ncbi:MAG: hypothetical protein WAV47_09260 [Blastocatellia bacterium]
MRNARKVTRRELLRGAGSFVSAAFLGDCVLGATRRKKRSHATRRVKAARFVDAGPLSGAKLYEDVIAYYNLGEHRTATEPDLKTSQWLTDQFRAAGLRATTQAFGLRQFFIHQTVLSIGARNIRAFPLWYPRGTGPTPLRAPLAVFKNAEPASVQGKIAVVAFPFDPRRAVVAGSGHAEVILAAARSGASALVGVTEGPTKEIVALNSPAGAQPWPIPVVLVGERDKPGLISAALTGSKASLVVSGEEDQDAKAKNVIARLDRGKDLIVVSTPQSGWFRCAGERGPGIALFLGLARWASRRASGSSFLFVSTSGHELGGVGMGAFLKESAPSPERVLCWIHLGAGIATYSWEETAAGLRRLREPDANRSLMTSPGLAPLLSASFAGLAGLTPTVERAVGEFEFILKAGYRTFGIAAGHRFHHTPADSPEMTGPEIIEPVGRAVVRTVEVVEAGGATR